MRKPVTTNFFEAWDISETKEEDFTTDIILAEKEPSTFLQSVAMRHFWTTQNQIKRKRNYKNMSFSNKIIIMSVILKTI